VLVTAPISSFWAFSSWCYQNKRVFQALLFLAPAFTFSGWDAVINFAAIFAGFCSSGSITVPAGFSAYFFLGCH